MAYIEFCCTRWRTARQRCTGQGDDIADHTRAEEERPQLLDSERVARAQLEAVFQAMSDGVTVTDMAGNFVFLNEAQARTSPYSGPERMKGSLADFTHVYELSHLDGRPLPFEDWPLSQILRGESVVNRELRVRHKGTGREWVFSFSGNPVRDPEGRQVLAVVITRDITERVKRDKQMAESEERLRLALAIAGMGTFDIDLLTDAVTVNDAGRAIYGWAPDEPLTFSKVQAYFHPDDREEVIRRVEAAFDPDGPGEFEVEQRIVRADGAVRWIRVRGRAEFETANGDGGRRAVRCLGTYLDVTDQKEAERERERLLAAERVARTEAEQAGRIKDEFLATLSHELRTPLNSILGWSHILGRGQADAATLAKGLAAIERNASSQAKLIEDLLDMSRIITGQIRLDVQGVELSEVIAAAVDTVRPAADAKDIAIRQALEPDAGPVRGDPNRLQQVVWNLLSNAVKFTPRGGEVRVALKRGESHAEVTVADTGQGIAPEFLPFVFDRFRQADGSTTRQHGGLGLGLAIVKQLVELHGGRVRADSPGKGQGATFAVELPLATVPREASRHVQPVEASAGGDAHRAICEALSLDQVTVLAVDDDPDALAIIRHVLEECHARVLTAGSASEALELLERERPDVLLSDIGMPEMDGYELIRRVRALGPGEGGDVPAAALTAFARPEDRTRAVRAGYHAHVAKPAQPAELVAVIASLAGRTP